MLVPAPSGWRSGCHWRQLWSDELACCHGPQRLRGPSFYSGVGMKQQQQQQQHQESVPPVTRLKIGDAEQPRQPTPMKAASAFASARTTLTSYSW